MVKKILKWTFLTLLVLVFAGFCAFLYFIPPFFVAAPETFTQDVPKNTPGVEGIADPAERAIAERGRYIVMTVGCGGCHTTPGPQGPLPEMFLAGGGKFITPEGTFISRNLTPYPDTGLTRRTDDEVKRVLQSGVFPDGHVTPYTAMPWANFSNWTEEDRHAVVVYLRHLKPVRHQIPEPTNVPADLGAGVIERDYAFKDYGVQ